MDKYIKQLFSELDNIRERLCSLQRETSEMSPMMTQDLCGTLQITVQNGLFPTDHEGLKVLKR